MRSALWLISLCSCVYPAAMKQGALLEAQGDYRGALAQYDRALAARPRSEEARAAREATVDLAIEQAAEDAGVALEGRQYAEVMEQVHYIEDLLPDHPEALRLRTETGDRMVRHARSAFEEGDIARAYDWAAWLKELLPQRSELPELLEQARSWFYASSEQHLAAGRWREALADLEAVSRREPDRASEVDQRAFVVRSQWAGALAQQADQEERQGLLGPALALRARAVEVAGRAEDQDAVSRLSAALRQREQLAVAIRWHGHAFRNENVWRVVSAAGPAVWAEGGLVADIHTPPAACGERWTTSVAEQPYVSGQRQVPNPQWGQLDAELASVRLALEQLVPSEVAAGQRLERARWEMRQAQQGLEPLAERLREAREHQESARAHIEGAQKMVAEGEAQLEQLRARAQAGEDVGAAILATEMTLANTRQRLNHQQERHARAEQTIAELQPQVEAARTQVQAARGAVDTAQSEVQALADRRAALVTQEANLQSQLASTPQTLWEDVVDLFRYEVQHWTRECAGEGLITVSGAGISPRSDRYVERQQTWDSTHPAFPAVGLPLDPLQYPVSDDELIRELDVRVGNGLHATLQAAIADAYALRLARAKDLFTRRPEQGAGSLLGLLLAAPGSVDEGTRGWVEDWLRTRYEIEAPGVLTGR